MEERDIRETGARGLRYDSNRGLGNKIGNTNPLLPFAYRSGQNVNRLTNMYAPPSKEDVGMELSELGFGKSQYDEGATNMFQAEHLDEFRAQEQPWYDQIANGALKMVTTAGTTFVDGTLGALWGIGTGVANWFDDDPNTGFWRGMWDNAVTNAMADVNDAMEKVATNYRSEWEQNASVFERMFSASGAANFWGDDILKNAGFTIGAAASIYATSAFGNLLKGLPSIGRLGEGLGLLTRGEKTLEATNSGKVASWIAKTFASTQGEATIEAINSTRESLKNMDAEVLSMRQSGEQTIRDEFKANVEAGIDIETALAISKSREEELNAKLKEYENQTQHELSKAGNMIYAANIAALSISNNLTLGSMIRGGYGNAKSLLAQAMKTANGQPINSVKEAGQALLKGDLRFAVPEVNGKFAKTAGYWALTSTQEGLEEGVQNLASNTGQIAAAARAHQWAKDNSILSSSINADAEEDLTSYAKALGKAYEDQFGSINSPGWTEVVAGFITGALGVPSAHINSEGNLRPTWQGGIREAMEEITGNQKAVQRTADALNKALTDNKFGDRVRHAVQQIAIRKGQEAALGRDDVQAYKNFEVQQLLSDAVFFRDLGMLDDYLAMYEAMADNVTDQDIAELKAAAKQENGKASALETMSDDDIKALYQDKAESALAKIKQSLDDYKAVEDKYGDKFSDETRREATMEMAFKDTLYWDTLRRAEEVEKQIAELSEKKRTPLEDKELDIKKKALTSLQKQAVGLREHLNRYKNNPEILQKEVEQRQLERQKVNLYKKAEEAIAKYKEADTLQDIVDVYSHSPIEDREQVLTQAIEQSEGETKTKLQQFKNYMGDVNALEQIIEDKFPIDDAATARLNVQKLQVFKHILNEAVNSMLADDSPVLTRATLKDKFKEKLDEYSKDLEEQKALAGSVVAGEDGNIDFSAALDSGEVDMDDFNSVLDDINTGDSHLEIKEGSRADKMADAAMNVKGLQGLIDDLTYFVDSLDKLDELKAAGKSKANKKTAKKGKKVTVEEEVIGGEEDNEGEDNEDDEDGGTFNFDDEDEGNPDEAASPSTSKPVDTSKFLTDEERATYSVKPKKGKSGITYNTVKKHGPENLKAKESVGKKFDRTENKLQAKLEGFRVADKRRKAIIIQDILDIIKNNLIGNRVMEEVENFFQANSKYLKTTSGEEEILPPHEGSKKELSETEVSLNANQHPAYVKSELSSNSKMVPVTHQKSGAKPVQVWLQENGLNIQEIIDFHLGKVIVRDKEKAVKDRTPVHYLHNEEQPNVVFLGLEYSQVEDVIPRDVAKTLIQGQDGKNYLIVGTLGWEASREGTKDMYQTILDSFTDAAHTSEGWYVNTEHTNRFKDIQAGDVPKQAVSDSKSDVRDLSELLQSKERNPNNLTIDDLGWTVIEGSERNPTRKVINGEASKVYAVKDGKPGQVYLNVPASNGNFVPILMETMFFEELDSSTPLYNEILNEIEILADFEAPMQDKKGAIARLNDMLIFSSGVNQIHLNDEKSSFDPNTIYITRNGKPEKVLDFSEDAPENATDILLQATLAINPRINLSTTLLDRNPSLYLNSGVLKTDGAAVLGTVNSATFLYPVDSEGNYVENKPFKGGIASYDASTKNRIYVGGKYVYYDGNKFTDKNGEPIEDEDGTLTAALKIKNGKIKPVKVRRANYYVVDGDVYVDNGHGGINIVGEELKEEVLKVKQGKNAKDTKSKKAREEASKIKKKKEEAPVDDKRLKAKTPEVDEEGDDWDEPDDKNTNNIVEIEVPTLTGGTRKVKAEKVSYSDLNKGDKIWVSGPETPAPLYDIIIEGTYQDGVYGNSGGHDIMLPKDRTYYREINKASDTSSKKSNFTNGTDIDKVKSQEELEAETAKNDFASFLKKQEETNEEKIDKLFDLIEKKFKVKANNYEEVAAELMKPKHKLDLSSNDLDTIIEQIEHCR